MNHWLKIILGLAGLVIAYFHCCVGLGAQSHSAGALTAASGVAALPLVDPRLTMRWQGGKVELDGLVPDAATREKFLAQAQSTYGAQNVLDQKLRLSGTEANAQVQNPAGWTEWSLQQLDALSQMRKFNANLPDGASLELEAQRLTVRGQLPDEPTRSQFMQTITAKLPANVRLNDLTTVLGNTLNETQITAQSEFNQAAINGIEFEVAKAEVNSKNAAANDATLSAVTNVLKKYPDIKVAISGHTDADGALAANMALSQARAKAVMQSLIAKGIVADRLTAQGFGPNQPIAANNTPEGKARNRRIEFKVVGGVSNVTVK